MCDLTHETCVVQSQLVACASLADGERCVADGTTGICDQAVCLPGCGDGVQGLGEECDDGNFLSHDGCSSRCQRELLGWEQWRSPWGARSSQVLAYHDAADVLVMFGGSVDGAVNDDHWQRDRDGTWRLLPLVPRPPARKDAAMAYDRSRQRLVLFGGVNDSGSNMGDTWEFDGTQWAQVVPSASPPARAGTALVFDEVRTRIVLFGGGGNGVTNDTWEYDGSTWIVVPSAAKPPGRAGHSMVWDPVRSRIVLYGGGVFFVPLGDTWERVGTAWNLISTPSAPSARADATMAFSTVRGTSVLFGGSNAYSDLWEYGATGWTLLPGNKTEAAGRRRAAMAADPVDGTVVLVGGEDLSGRAFDDVWRLDGSAVWSSRPPELAPTQRESKFAYDETRDVLVLFSGSGTNAADTWTFDDLGWTKGAPPSVEFRFWHAIGYDSTRDRTVVFGGLDVPGFDTTDDTFELDGSTGQWMARSDLVRPPARARGSLGFDGTHLVLFGGQGAGAGLGDTWELDDTGWREITSSGAVAPAAQTDLAMTYDPVGHRLVAFDDAATTWAYAGSAWSALALPDGPPPRRGAGLTFDRYRGRIVLYGGHTDDTILTDVWELADTGWVRQDVIGSPPPPRLHFAFHSQRLARGLVLFGGTTGTTLFGDTWILQRRSSTPDERCDNGSDDDGDRHADGDDPDCAILTGL
jgi:cysteine-rich repeat protein